MKKKQSFYSTRQGDKTNIYTYNTALKNWLAKFGRENLNCAKLIIEYPCGAVAYEVDKKHLSSRFTSPYSEERRKKARKYAQEHNIVSNLNNRHFKRKKH